MLSCQCEMSWSLMSVTLNQIGPVLKCFTKTRIIKK